MRVIQLQNKMSRCLAIVDGSHLSVLGKIYSLYALAVEADRLDLPIARLAETLPITETLDYEPIYSGHSRWHIMPALDHPLESARCLVSGTGLTHTGSAKSRNSMHVKSGSTEPETDSMRMFRWGMEGGKPAQGTVGAAPEWFYKGTGEVLRGCGDTLVIPPFAESGGEESEVVGLYLIGMDGTPRRIGFTTGNEFSDHVFEKRNYLYLAHSKLRACSVGPEAVIGETLPETVTGLVTIERRGQRIWDRRIESGEANMCHSLRNIEHHHFKYPGHCRPGDIHVHFFGAATLSFSAGIRIEAGDVVTISWDGFGRPLHNTVINAEGSSASLVKVRAL